MYSSNRNPPPQIRTRENSDSGTHPKLAWPKASPHRLGQHLRQRWVIVQNSTPEETFPLAAISPWGQRVTDLIHTESVCPLSQPASRPLEKLSWRRVGRGALGASGKLSTPSRLSQLQLPWLPNNIYFQPMGSSGYRSPTRGHHQKAKSSER